jgi:hypothetical protein
VDPLTRSYPWYTPYQFAGNTPIKFIDLDGLEPSENPKDGNMNAYAAAADVLLIQFNVNFQNFVQNGSKSASYLEGKMVSGFTHGLKTKVADGNYYESDTDQPDQLNIWTNQNGVFEVDESNASEFRDYPLFVINTMLNRFVDGTGPENYIFPENGIVSSQLANSSIVKNALSDYKKNGFTGRRKYSFGGLDLLSNLNRENNIVNLEGFVGSGTITITTTESDIKVEVFNITSLSSGALTAKIPPGQLLFNVPKSYVRDPSMFATPFGNISQTYFLSFPK